MKELITENNKLGQLAQGTTYDGVNFPIILPESDKTFAFDPSSYAHRNKIVVVMDTNCFIDSLPKVLDVLSHGKFYSIIPICT